MLSDNVIRFTTQPCALGCVLVAQSSRGVCAIFLGDEADVLSQNLRSRFPHGELREVKNDAGFEHTLAQNFAQIQKAVEQPGLTLNLPLDVRGTPFQQRVWQALRQIPSGTTASYTDIARRIQAPTAVRAVAQACAANLLAVVIPCHRVIRRDGGLSGYRWGLARKRALLERERAAHNEERTS